ncbi:MAG: GHKL domain-containing protein [Anaerolineales bacterium]|nr:GHKL domain-containing protein [Anaerolineales bacterium]
MITRLKNWLNNIPIADPINRQMAVLLQIILLGFMGVLLIAATVNLFLSETTTRQTILGNTAFFILALTGLFIFLRRGYFYSITFIIISIFVFVQSYAILVTSLLEVQDTLTFYTLAVLLAGLLINPRALWGVFALCVSIIIFGVIQEVEIEQRLEGISIAGNFILLNGLMSVFVSRFGVALRTALQNSLQRENELRNEIAVRKKIESHREKLIRELEANNAELERFTYTVSHDLRSPLVTIKGFLGMLQNAIQVSQEERINDNIQRISNAADKMESMLAELLELSRVGRVLNTRVRVNIAEVTKEAIELLNAHIAEKNIQIKIADDLPIVFADYVRLREVMQNLIDNAIKYSSSHPNPVVEIGSKKLGDEIFIFVKDNGIGVARPYYKKIFGLFEKLDPNTEGTGIGLALVKRIIEWHGGKIWVESDGEGKGATFYFTIPENSKDEKSQ